MTGMVYLMKSKAGDDRIKFGHRTKETADDVRDEVNAEYGSEYCCIAVYNLQTETDTETEEFVRQIRTIISAAAGAVQGESPDTITFPLTQHFKLWTRLPRLGATPIILRCLTNKFA